jgi:hypothetical protein
VTIDRYAGNTKAGPSYGAQEDLYFVRVEPVRHNALSSIGDAKNDRFLVYIDAKNSQPEGFIPGIKDRVTFQGQTMTVRTISEFTGSGGEIHHYEVRLV